MSDELFFDGARYISAADAATVSNLTRDYVARLAREEKVVGRQVGRQWYVSEESLRAFVMEQEYTNSQRRGALVRERQQEYGRTQAVGASEKKTSSRSVSQKTALAQSSVTKPSNDLHRKLAEAAMRGGAQVVSKATAIVGNASTQVPLYAVSPGFELLHKVAAAVLALVLVVGLYSAEGSLVATSPDLIPGTSVSPQVELTATAGFVGDTFAKISSVLQTGADAFLAPLFGVHLAQGNSSGVVSLTITQRPSTSPALAVAQPTNQTTVVNNNPVIERVVESQRVIASGGITQAQLSQQLQELDNELSDKIFTATAANSTAIAQNYNVIAQTNAIDQLTNTTINTPSISGGSINGTSINASSLSVSGTATSTFGGGIDLAGGCFAINGTCISGGGGGAGNPGGSDTQVQFNDGGVFNGSSSFTFNKTTSTLSVLNASTTNATSTNFAAINLAVSGVASTSNLVVSNGLTLGSLTGFLKATAGVVSTSLVNLASDVTGVLPVGNGGTGTSTTPSYGQVLVGNSGGGYSLVATSSLGITGSGGSSASSTLLTDNNTFIGGNLFFASTTIGNGNQNGGLTVNGGATTTGNFIVQGNLGIGTTTPGSILSINGVGNFVNGATSTLYNGLNITTGCFSVNGTCVGNGTGSSNVSTTSQNSWSALQIFAGNASSSNFSNFGTAYFGGSATSSFNSSGQLTLAGISNSLLSTNGSGQVVGTTTIGNNQLANSSITVNGTLFNLGENHTITAASSTLLSNNNTFSGNDVFSNIITGSISGNAGTVTNGVYTTTFNGLFDNRLSATTSLPNITTLASLSLPYSQLTGAPAISAYPFALSGNATSTLTQFNGGLTAFASSTIGAGGQTTGLTINGGATTTGSAYFGGNVGIGTQSPSSLLSINYTFGGTAPLTISQAGTPVFSVDHSGLLTSNPATAVSGGSLWSFGAGVGQVFSGGIAFDINPYSIDSTSYLFRTAINNSTKFIINGSGQVGIGTVSPSYLLDVNGAGHFTSLVDADHFVATSSSVASFFNGGFLSAASSTIGNGTQGGGLTVNGGATTTGNAYFGGNVGIGTANPESNLQISSASTASTNFNVTNTSAGGHDWAFSTLGSSPPLGTTGSFLVYDNTANAARLLINSSGNVGIGTTNPNDKLEVNGTASSSGLVVSTLSGLLKANGTSAVTAAVAGTDYVTPAGLALAYPFLLTGNATSTLTQFNGGLTAYASSTIGAGGQTTGLTIFGGATTTGNALISGTLNVTGKTTLGNASSTVLSVSGNSYLGTAFASAFALGNVLTCSGSEALQTDGSGNVSCGTIATGGASSGGGWTTNNTGLVSLSTTTDQVVVGSPLTPHAKVTILSGNTATTTLALVAVSSQTADLLDLYGPSGALSSVITSGGSLGLGTTSPYAQFSLAASSLGTTPLVSISTSTASATTTVFAINSNGNTTIGNNGSSLSINGATTTAANGINLTTGCFSVGGTCLTTGGGSSFAYLFPSNATSTTLTFSSGLLSLASTTIGNGNQNGGLTINGGATTTGNSLIQGSQTVNGNLALGSYGDMFYIGDSGTARLDSDTGGTGYSRLFATTRVTLQGNNGDASGNTVSLNNGSIQVLTVNNSNTVGIGSTTPGATLGVNGSGLFSSALTASYVNVTSPTGLLINGIAALQGSTTLNNYFFGGATTSANLLGQYNYAIGQGALANATSSSVQSNFAVGYQALMGSTTVQNTGSFNIAIGYQAGQSNTSGGTNNFLGYRAGQANTSGQSNNFIGIQAGSSNTTGQNNNFIGPYAGSTNTTGSQNNFFGSYAGLYNTTGNNNNFIGQYAGFHNISGTNNTGVGNQAGYSLTTGFSNTLLGDNTTVNNVITSGFGNIGLGSNTFFPNAAGNNQLNIGNILFGTLPATTTGFLLPTSGTIGIGTSTPFAEFAISANNGMNNPGNNLFLIASSTASATTTLFSVSNTGSTTIANGVNITAGCFAQGGNCLPTFANLAAAYPFALSGNATSTLTQFNGGLTAYATSTIGNGTQIGGLTINGGATTTLNAYFGGNVGIGTTTPLALLTVTAQNSAVYPGNNLFLVSSSTGSGTTNLFSVSNTGIVNAALGFNINGIAALQGSTTLNNYFFGGATTSANLLGQYNYAIGQGALANATSSVSFNFAVGYQALMGSSTAQNINFDNIAIGYQAGQSNTTGTYNNFLGAAAGRYNTSGSNNNFFGASAGSSNTTGSYNNFFGTVGGSNTSGSDNNFMGTGSGSSNTTGTDNNFIGSYTGDVNNAGSFNVALGFAALRSNSTGLSNTAIGSNAGRSITSGYSNLIVGDYGTALFPSPAPVTITTGYGNVGIGPYVFFPNPAGNSQLNIGNILFGTLPATTTGFQLPTAGTIGIGTTSPFAKFAISLNNGDTSFFNNAFLIASSTGSATTTLFSVDNTGSTTIANGVNITSGCFAQGGNCLTLGSFGGILSIANGGTGTSTAPSYGQLLLGNASGGYNYAATSSLGLLGPSSLSGASVISYTPSTGVITTQPGTFGGSGTYTFPGDILFSNATSTGNIVPNATNTYTLGSPAYTWKSVYIGPGSLFVNGQEVVHTDVGDNVIVSSSVNENLELYGTGSTNIIVNPSGTGNIQLQGPTQITGGDAFTTSNGTPVLFTNGTEPGNLELAGNTISAVNTNGGISISPAGIGGTYITNGSVGIGTTNPGSKLEVEGTVAAQSFNATSSSLVSLFAGGFLSSASSTIASGLFTAIGGASTTNLTASGEGYFGTASTTNLIVGTPSSILSTNGSGAVGALTVGASLSLSSNTLSLNTGNANIWSALQQFTAGASTTVLSVSNGSATTTLTAATSTFAGGITLTSGCLFYNGSCIGANAGFVGSGTQGQFAFYQTNGSTVVGTSTVFATQAGNVGIGSSTAGLVSGANRYLTITSIGANTLPALELAGSTNVGGATVGRISFYNQQGNDEDAQISTVIGSDTGSGSLIFSTANAGSLAEAARIDNNGYLGIGTTTPLALLTVTAQNSAVYPGNNLFLVSSSTGSGTTNLFSVSNTGIVNAALGFNINGIAALQGSTTLNNYFFGGATTSANLLGQYNYAIGQGALANATSSSVQSNFAVGYQALMGSSTAQNTGAFNIAIGYQAGQSNTTGGTNNFFGYQAGQANTTGSYNNFFGIQAGLVNTTGQNNNFIGPYAGSNNTNGSNNNIFGNYAGLYNTTGNNNNFIGQYAGFHNISGTSNTGVGNQAGYSLSTGYSNTLIGDNSTTNNTITSGFGNIGLGSNVFFQSPTANRQLNIGNILFGTLPATTTGFVLPTSGAIGIGTTTPFAEFAISANNGMNNPGNNVFLISSSTSGATTTLFSVSNTGTTTLGLFGTCNTSQALQTDSSGHIVCGSITGGTSASSTLLSDNNTFSGTNTFTKLLSLTGGASTTQLSVFNKAYFGATATSTFDSSGNLTLAGLGTPAGAFLAVNANGQVISTTTPSGSSLTGTTGQVAYFSGTNTAVGTSSLFIASNGNVGIGTTSPWGILSLAAASLGTTPLVSISTSTASATTTVFQIDQNGNTTIGNNGSVLTINGATTTAANGINLTTGCFAIGSNCLTLGSFSGTLAIANGGTGASSLTGDQFLYTNHTGTQVLTAASSSLNLPNAALQNSSLSVSAGSGLSGGGSVSLGGSTSLSLNLASANTWTALQQFNANASTTLLSVSNGSATTTLSYATSTFAGGINLTTGCFASGGNCLTLGSFSGTLAIANGGTNQTTFTSGQPLAYNGTSFVSTSTLSAVYGGTGVNNGGNTITLGGNINTASSFTTSGANALTLTTTGSTNVTLPLSGTLAALNGTNSWTGLNVFTTGASTTQLSVFNKAYFGATATSTFDSSGNLSLVSNGLTVGSSQLIVSGGNVGIGTTSPLAILTVSDNTANANTNAFLVSSSTASATTTLFSVSNSGLTTIGDSSGSGDANFQFAGDSNAWSVGYYSTDKSFQIASSTALGTNVAFAIQKSTLNVGIGTTTPGATLTVAGAGCFAKTSGGIGCSTATVAGDIYYGNAHASGGFDVAEQYAAVSVGPTTPGTIVGLDYTGTSTLAVATTSANMIGIISTNPGLTFGNYGATASTTPLALSGRVPVKVSLQNGIIQVGDRITLSSIPGVGMKARPLDPSVGIALEPYTTFSASSSIMTFVTLQQGTNAQAIADALIGSSTAATSTPGVITPFLSSLFSEFTQWFASASNGIHDLYATIIHSQEVDTQTLCVSDSTGAKTCITKAQLDALLASAQGGSASGGISGGGSSSGGSTPAPSGAPVISVSGANPATIDVGATYSDLGATITGPTADLNLGISASVDGATSTPMSGISIDTSVAGTHTVVYSATDQNGLTGTATRTIVVSDPHAATSTASTTTPVTTDPTTASSTPVIDTTTSTSTATSTTP